MRLQNASDFEAVFSKYLSEVQHATNEEIKAFLFVEFVRKAFSGVTTDFAENLYPVLQKHLARKRITIALTGRLDAMLGNLIIEFKQNLAKQLPEAESQLKLYVAILWSNQGKKRVNYQVMACDGTKVQVYRSSTKIEPGVPVDPKDIDLETLDGIDFEKIKNPMQAFIWLDRYILFKTKLPPTGDAFAERFGRESPSFKQAIQVLKEAWQVALSSVTVMYEEWARYLRFVYGGEVASEDLFLRHTYLATLAKLVVYTYYSPALPNRDDIVAALQGVAFKKLNILNFLEEDFFSWIGRKEAENAGVQVATLIFDVLATFNLTAIDEDVLKELYQQLVDPSERHELGEYYTPDWLAETIVKEALQDDAKARVLDPAAGSGTFLVSALHWKQEKLANMDPDELLSHLTGSVVGLDIHPLAVIIAKANYLIAVKDIVKKRRGAFSLPIYMANSIDLPAEVQEFAKDPSVKSYVREVKAPTRKVTLRIPTEVAEDSALTDQVITAVRDFAREVKDSKTADRKTFQTRMEILAPQAKDLPKSSVVVDILFETALAMKQLSDEGRDTIWAFILRNIYRPLFLSKDGNKFDRLVGNPPWLSFRYITDVDYQSEIKNLMRKYDIFPPASLITQMELATLFFLRAAELYLKDSGQIMFVMPRSVFSSDQHDKFRRRTKGVSLTSIKDLEGVSPLFKVPSCVVSANKSGKTKYPLPGVVYEGDLSSKNMRLAAASKLLRTKDTHFVLCEVGTRSFLMQGKKTLRFVGQSHYFDQFKSGANIYPRSYWLVDPSPDARLGFDPSFPYLVSSERAIATAKGSYAQVKLKGNVEPRFLYAVVTGSELVPFATTTLPIAVLPVEPKDTGFGMLTKSTADKSGAPGLASWLSAVEKSWAENRGEKADKMDVYKSLDYSNKLSSQRPKAKFKVVYNAAGTNLCAAVIRQGHQVREFDGQELTLNGIVAEHKVVWMDTDIQDEAYYICAVLNSRSLDRLVKPMQSRGQFGERDIEKKPLEFPIPRYDPKNKVHRKLMELGVACSTQVRKALPNIEKKYTSLGKVRGDVREFIKDALDQIDALVLQLLSKNEEVLDYFG